MKKYLCIDIGGTAIKYGLVTEKGDISHKETYQAYFDGYKRPLIDTITSSVNEYHDKLVADNIVIDGIAASVTGDVNPKTHYIVDSCGNIPDWRNINLAEKIFNAIGKEYPFTMLNDANAAALAEMWIGNAVDFKDAIVYTIGTGIGGGVIVDGKILNGYKGFGGNIGHMVIADGEDICTCGNHGCFEHLASTRALLRNAKKAGFDVDGEEIFEKAKSIPELQAVVDKFFYYHGVAIGSLLHIFNPEAIIIG
ncbi:MAG: ROK family protein, partial [Christensenellaceae bacterium]|nr:ROK family protein [Christensenellaceae bacterium]